MQTIIHSCFKSWSAYDSCNTYTWPLSLDVKVWLCPCVQVYKGSYCGRYNGQILPVLAIKHALLPLTFKYIPYLHSQTLIILLDF